MKYKIGSEVKPLTSAKGNNYVKFNIKDESGVITKGVVAFPSFHQYEMIAPGVFVEGILKEKEYNGQKSYILENLQMSGPKRINDMMQKKSESIAKTMERKEEGIKHTLDRKEFGIMISSTFRDATLLTSAFADELENTLPNIKEERIKSIWLKWRQWLIQNYNPLENDKLTSLGDKVPFEDESQETDFEEDPIPF